MNLMLCGQIVCWVLYEVGVDYDQVIVDFYVKLFVFFVVNLMGKVLMIVYYVVWGECVVIEVVVICVYFVEMYFEVYLLFKDEEMVDYLCWLLFVVGLVEQVVILCVLKFEFGLEQEVMVGWGSFDWMMDMFEVYFVDNVYVCGLCFMMVDVYVGSVVDWGMIFGIILLCEVFVVYVEWIQVRLCYKVVKVVDNVFIVEMKK